MWDISSGAQTASNDALSGPLRGIPLDEFTSPLAHAPLDALPNQTAYAETLRGLFDLFDEFRFEVALGLMLLVDFEIAVQDGRAKANTIAAEAPLPPIVQGLMAPYMREAPPPSLLFATPYEHLSGSRVLQTWFAAQQFDSALFRGIAALDRLASLIWLAAGLPLPTRKNGSIRFLSFRPEWAADMRAHLISDGRWGALREPWEAIEALVDSPLIEYVLAVRNGFAHGLRMPSELHGGQAHATSVQTLVVRALKPAEHEALAVAYFDTSLRSATKEAGKVISVLHSSPSG